MEKHETPAEQMAELAAEMTEVMVAGQTAGLRILAAEMQALTQLMPGLAHPAGEGPTDAEIEAEFDNMPV
jgi:hypothetical protein